MKYFEGMYQDPSHQTLKKRMDVSFLAPLTGGEFLTKQIQIDYNSDLGIPRL